MERREGSGESRRGRSGQGWGRGIPCGAGSRRGWLEEVEKQSPRDSEVTQGVRENWLDPGRASGPSVEKGPWEASGACTQWGTKEPVWAKGPSVGVGLCGGTEQPLGSSVMPQSQPSAEGFRASGRQALQGPH